MDRKRSPPRQTFNLDALSANEAHTLLQEMLGIERAMRAEMEEIAPLGCLVAERVAQHRRKECKQQDAPSTGEKKKTKERVIS